MTDTEDWTRGPMVGYDLETTGVDVENDRIVEAVAILREPGREPQVRRWIVDPGIEIPAEAAAVHGYTSAYVAEHGMTPALAMAEIRETLRAWWVPGVPLIGHNPSFDLTVTDREFARRLDDGLALDGRFVVDTLTIDRANDRYVKGSGQRKLGPTVLRYGLPELKDAHRATADVNAAMDLAVAQARRFPRTCGDLAALQDAQRRWDTEWAEDFANRYLTREIAGLERAWTLGLEAAVSRMLRGAEATRENVDKALGEMRARRADVLERVGDWPLRPRPVG